MICEDLGLDFYQVESRSVQAEMGQLKKRALELTNPENIQLENRRLILKMLKKQYYVRKKGIKKDLNKARYYFQYCVSKQIRRERQFKGRGFRKLVIEGRLFIKKLKLKLKAFSK